MAEKAKQIIRQHWSKRHDPDPGTRKQAVGLVKAHIAMLRKWESEDS